MVYYIYIIRIKTHWRIYIKKILDRYNLRDDFLHSHFGMPVMPSGKDKYNKFLETRKIVGISVGDKNDCFDEMIMKTKEEYDSAYIIMNNIPKNEVNMLIKEHNDFVKEYLTLVSVTTYKQAKYPIIVLYLKIDKK